MNAPVQSGFAAGMFLDNSVNYVGYGDISGPCSSEVRAPGRVTVVAPAGSYVSKCQGPIFDAKTPYYLLNHAGLRWNAATSTTLSGIKNLVKVQGTTTVFYVGRVNLTTSGGVKYTQVGKVHGTLNKIMYSVGTTEVSETSGFEALSCV